MWLIYLFNFTLTFIYIEQFCFEFSKEQVDFKIH